MAGMDFDQERVEQLIREVTDEEAAHFAEFGWVKLPRLVDPELAGALLARAQAVMGKDGTSFRREADAAYLWNDYPTPSLSDPLFRSVMFSRSMGRNALRFMHATLPGTYSSVRYWHDGLFVRLPKGTGFGEGSTPYHQDMGSFSADERVGKVNFWMALDEIPVERGALRFRSGSHRLGLLGLPVGGPKGNRTMESMYPRLDQWCPISDPMDLQPGDATVHHALTIHGSSENTTDKPRWAYDFIYIPPDTCWNGMAPPPGADAPNLRPLMTSQDAGNCGFEPNEPFGGPLFPITYSE